MAASLMVIWLLSLLAVGCSRPPTKAECEARSVFAIQAIVRDKETSHSAVPGATIIVRDGSYVDSRTAPQLNIKDVPAKALYLFGALERPGTYSVVIRKAGYKEWRQDGVVVGMARQMPRQSSAP